MGTKGTYLSEPVDVVRPAKQGDPGYNGKAGEQVIIKLKDGTEKTVAKTEVTES